MQILAYKPKLSDNFLKNIKAINLSEIDLVEIPTWIYVCENLDEIRIVSERVDTEKLRYIFPRLYIYYT